ncbi:MAG: hypothetical protein R2710_15340 [Acidimicrobiales bacterium]
MTTPPSMPVMDQAFWDQRYAAADQIWSGNPNPHLVADASNLAPGRALDVGAGEGPTPSGWPNKAGPSPPSTSRRSPSTVVGSRLNGVATPSPIASPGCSSTCCPVRPLPEGPFDLIGSSSCTSARSSAPRSFERCIDAVAPGGTLLIVAHHPSDLETACGGPRCPVFTPPKSAGLLGDDWRGRRCGPPREATDLEGVVVTIHDTMLLARREG